MIYFVRHGQTVNNVQQIFYDDSTGPGLTALGVEQATAAAAQLKDIKFDICYCSSKQRAVQTMQIITQYHPDLPVVYDERLAERSYGSLGNTVYTGHPAVNRWHRDTVLATDVETIDACFARVKSFLDDTNDPTKNILVVAHGGIYKLVHCYFHGFPADGDLSQYRLDNCACVTFA